MSSASIYLVVDTIDATQDHEFPHWPSSSVVATERAVIASACCLSGSFRAMSASDADMRSPETSDVNPPRQLRVINSISENAADRLRLIEAFASTPVIWFRAISDASISTRLKATEPIQRSAQRRSH